MRGACKVLLICLVAVGFVCSGCTSSPNAQLQKNKALIHRVVDQIHEQKWAEFTELHTRGFVCHTPASPKPQTREELVQSLRELYATFPDWRATVEDTVAEGDKVVIRQTCRGTHKGDIKELGLTATGKEITLPVTIIFRIEDGKIAEAWEEYDMMSVMQQLGAMPSGQ